MIFTTRERPARGHRGWHRVTMRHGVSRITSGTRYTLGVIFHDAKYRAAGRAAEGARAWLCEASPSDGRAKQ